MGRLWMELFELVFGGTHLYPKWGDSVLAATTVIKLLNNNNKPHDIGSKVDGRVLSREDQSLDFCHMEASKTFCTESKLQHDKVKLVIKTECFLDSIVLKSNYPAINNSPASPNIQIPGIKARIHILTLVDSGLYTSSMLVDLSLPENIALLAEEMELWCRKLKNLRSACMKNSTVYTPTANPVTKHNLLGDTSDHHQSNYYKEHSLFGPYHYSFLTNGPYCYPFLTNGPYCYPFLKNGL